MQDAIEPIQKVKDYAASRYYRWLDYAAYHTSLAKIPNEANDVLNEVIVQLFSKDFNKLIRLFSKRRGLYTELDFYVLQMLKLNIYSPTSPYRYRYRNLPLNTDVQLSKLEIKIENDKEPDKAGTILKQVKLVRYVFERLELTELERAVFDYRFVQGRQLSQWPGDEKHSLLYRIFSIVRDAIHQILYQNKLTNLKMIHKDVSSMRRMRELVSSYNNNRNIFIN